MNTTNWTNKLKHPRRPNTWRKWTEQWYTGHRCKYKHSAAQFQTLPSCFFFHLSEQREDVGIGRRRSFGPGPSSFFNNRRKSVLIRQCFGKHFSLKREIRESHLLRRLRALRNALIMHYLIYHTGEHVINHKCHRFPVEINYIALFLRTQTSNLHKVKILLIKPPPWVSDFFLYT